MRSAEMDAGGGMGCINTMLGARRADLRPDENPLALPAPVALRVVERETDSAGR